MHEASILRNVDRNASWHVVDSPIGPLTLIGTASGLEGLLFGDETGRCRNSFPAPPNDAPAPALLTAAQQLREYFAGERHTFEIPLTLNGTPFQRRVWDALLRIPYGQTTTYGHLATLLGQPTALRAVGAANGRNPIAIVVPCHRVIGSNGDLTGFGGGLSTKAWLLNHERAIAPAADALPFTWTAKR
jgi:methylated-DNA-[protein]-cysteine S-methyltransferase